jgi:RimJ/RimL family protein N-acetyltransferase
MTEALIATLRYCFTDVGVNSVFGETRPSNAASARVMLKAGMRFIGSFPSRSEGGVVHHRYIAFRDEWLLDARAPTHLD